MSKNKIVQRLICYFGGLFIMTLGIAVSIKVNLGVSPVSSLPKTLTTITGIDMGITTVLVHSFFVLLQIILLRKNYKVKNLLQIPVGIVFGLFTSLSNNLICNSIPDFDSIILKAVLTALSIFLIALGLFFYMPSDIMPLAGEGLTLAMNQVFKIKVHICKIIVDVSCVFWSLVIFTVFIWLTDPSSFGAIFSGLLAGKPYGDIYIGTVLAAFLVGWVFGILNKFFGKARDRLLK